MKKPKQARPNVLPANLLLGHIGAKGLGLRS